MIEITENRKVPACKMQGAEAVARSAVDVCAAVAQQLRNVCMASIACNVNRTHAVAV